MHDTSVVVGLLLVLEGQASSGILYIFRLLGLVVLPGVLYTMTAWHTSTDVLEATFGTGSAGRERCWAFAPMTCDFVTMLAKLTHDVRFWRLSQ